MVPVLRMLGQLGSLKTPPKVEPTTRHSVKYQYKAILGAADGQCWNRARGPHFTIVLRTHVGKWELSYYCEV